MPVTMDVLLWYSVELLSVIAIVGISLVVAGILVGALDCTTITEVSGKPAFGILITQVT